MTGVQTCALPIYVHDPAAIISHDCALCSVSAAVSVMKLRGWVDGDLVHSLAPIASIITANVMQDAETIEASAIMAVTDLGQ